MIVKGMITELTGRVATMDLRPQNAGEELFLSRLRDAFDEGGIVKAYFRSPQGRLEVATWYPDNTAQEGE